MKAFTDWQQSRRLTSRRAGVSSQRFASGRLDRYVRSHVRLILSALVVLALLGATEWVLLSGRPGFQGFAAGLTVGIGLAFLYHWMVISSGATSGLMGQAAEEWTDAELRRLRRKGWNHVSHLVIKPELGDIDHVAVGPDGVIVIETKWRSAEVDVDDLPGWMNDGVNQARRNRDQVRRLLNWRERDSRPIEALVVIWGPDVTHSSAEAVLRNDVNVIAGEHLRDELESLSDERLSPEEVQEIHAVLARRIADRDKWEAEHLPPPPESLQKRANRWAMNAAAAWVGLLLALVTFRFGWWAFGAIAALVIAGVAMRQVEELRGVSSWFAGGVLATFPLVLVAAVWSL